MNFYFFLIVKHIIIFQIIIPYFSISECNYHTPIRNTSNDECIIGECLIREFENNLCIIDNQIVKTQWINNFLIPYEFGFNYIDFCISLNGDLISLITSDESNTGRIFLYVKGEDGRNYFSDDQEYPFHGLSYSGNGREHINIFTLKLNNTINDEEYLMSISAFNDDVELYETFDGPINSGGTSGAFQVEYISSYVSSFIELGNNYYSLFLIGNEGDDYFLCIYKLLLVGKNILFSSNYVLPNYTKYKCSNAKIVSCFKSVKNYIVCFYQDILKNYVEIIFDLDINEQKNETIVEGILDTDKFFKGVHFTEETGAFLYYDNLNKTNILFKKYENSQINNHFNSFEGITLNIQNLNMDVELNDLIKISDLKICFTSVSQDKKDLYIIIINNYDTINEKIKIKYYLIHMYNLYLYEFNNKIKTIIFNGYIVFGSSFSDMNDEGYPGASIIMFSYPNCKDINFDITDNLMNFENILIDVNSKCQIDNNIFGLKKNGIKIIDITEGYKLLSTKDNRKIITGDYIQEDENITFVISKTLSIPLKGKIIFALEAKEPDYNTYKQYTNSIENINGEDTESNYFTPKIYLGRYSYCTFEINKDSLTDQCEDEFCEFCLSDNTCIKCKNKFKLTQDGNDKICLDNNTFYEEDMAITIPEFITTIPEKVETTIPEKVETTIPEKVETTIPGIETTIPGIEITIPEITNTTQNEKIETTILGFPENTIPKNIQYTLPINIFDTIATTLDKSEIIIPETSVKNDIKNNCTNEEIKNNKCLEGEITISQIENIKNELLKSNNTNKIIKTKNVIIQLSTLDDQKNLDNPGVSNIDLGECEKILKDKNNISEYDSLIIFKLDIKTEDFSSTFVDYEIYDPKITLKLSLDECKDVQIIIATPIVLDDNIELIYDSLSESGYNLFNENDSFYHDICATYTTVNGTDILLSDRKTDIFASTQNQTMCQTGCELESYNSTKKKAICNCNIKKVALNDLFVDNLFDMKEISNNFYKTLSNSNFQVLKCYKLLFSSLISKNIGEIFMAILLVIVIILNIISYINGPNKIHSFIDLIIRNKTLVQNSKIKSKNNNKRKKTNGKRNTNKNISNPKKKMKKKKTKVNKEYSIKKAEDNINSSYNLNKKKGDFKIRKGKAKNIKNNKNINKINKKDKYKELEKNDIKVFKKNRNNSHKFSTKTNSIESKYTLWNNIAGNQLIKNTNKPQLNNKQIQENYNDQELNNLEYDLAIKYDKRTYFEYYCSLLKRKQLILFTFLPANDYNVNTIKISLFLLSFGLYFAINGFFFSDKTMHKIYEDNGAFNILFQIPQILYSTVVSALINMILKMLSLSEKNILQLKEEKDPFKIAEKAKDIEKYIKIKFILFFILNFIFMSFFCYFISCFCAVYINTQIILIKDTLISFALSMAYPFGLNLLPGFFRIPSLRGANKDKKCLYKFSTIIALIL